MSTIAWIVTGGLLMSAIAMMGGLTTVLSPRVLEQLLHWHHCHRADAACRKPKTYLILLGDGLHNFLGGLAIASAFLVDPRVGITSWIAAAAHEVPQELGDFGVLVHGGWSRGRTRASRIRFCTSALSSSGSWPCSGSPCASVRTDRGKPL